MAAKTTDNLTAAIDALTAEAGTPVEREALFAYMHRIDEVIEACRVIKDEHKKTLRAEQSRASKARSKARIDKALALLDAQEAAEAE